MAWKDWGAPLVAAAVTFAGLWVVQDRIGGAAQAEEPDLAYAFPGPAWVPAGADGATVLVVARSEHPLGVDPATGITWRSAHVGSQMTGPANHRHAAPDAPRLGMDGFNATRVTVHVFDAAGELVFSNAGAAERERLTRTLTPEQLPAGVWYLGGNATTPPGTQRLPPLAGAFVDRLRPVIVGLPEGGIATTQSNALVSLYGTLFVTLRVDELVHAP